MGAAVPCALAQDPNPKPADKSAGAAAAAAQSVQTAQEADPLKSAPTAKQKKQQEKVYLKVEFSRAYKKWLERRCGLDHHRRREGRL